MTNATIGMPKPDAAALDAHRRGEHGRDGTPSGCPACENGWRCWEVDLSARSDVGGLGVVRYERPGAYARTSISAYHSSGGLLLDVEVSPVESLVGDPYPAGVCGSSFSHWSPVVIRAYAILLGLAADLAGELTTQAKRDGIIPWSEAELAAFHMAER